MKLKFDEPCICLDELGYDSVKQWWKLCNEFEEAKKTGFRDNDPEKYFIYGEAYKITLNDCKFVSTNCKAEFHKNNKAELQKKQRVVCN